MDYNVEEQYGYVKPDSYVIRSCGISDSLGRSEGDHVFPFIFTLTGLGKNIGCYKDITKTPMKIEEACYNLMHQEKIKKHYFPVITKILRSYSKPSLTILASKLTNYRPIRSIKIGLVNFSLLTI